MCLLHCSWLSHLYIYWFSRSERIQFYFVCNPHSHILMCLLHCSWLSHLYIYWFSRSERIQFYFVCKPHSYVLASLLKYSWLSHLYIYWFLRSERVQFYSICKLHCYLLASLLMALASLHPLISETRDRSGSIPFLSHILMCLFHCSWLSHLHVHWFLRPEVVRFRIGWDCFFLKDTLFFHI